MVSSLLFTATAVPPVLLSKIQISSYFPAAFWLLVTIVWTFNWAVKNNATWYHWKDGKRSIWICCFVAGRKRFRTSLTLLQNQRLLFGQRMNYYVLLEGLYSRGTKKRLKSWGRSRIFLKKGVSLRNEVTDGWRKPIFCKILATLESDRLSQEGGSAHCAPYPPLGRGNHEHDWTRFRRRTHSTPEFKITKYRQVGLYWLIPKNSNFSNKNNLKAVYFLFHRFSIFTC